MDNKKQTLFPQIEFRESSFRDSFCSIDRCTSFRTKNYLKGTVSVISSDPPLIKWHVWSLIALSDQVLIAYPCFWKLIISILCFLNKSELHFSYYRNNGEIIRIWHFKLNKPCLRFQVYCWESDMTLFK